MSFEILVGLNVLNDTVYQQYRDAMTPILSSFGGDFGYDLVVSQVLKSPCKQPINRVFTLVFPSQQNKDAFFNDPQYLKVKEQYFEVSVGATTLMASYQNTH